MAKNKNRYFSKYENISSILENCKVVRFEEKNRQIADKFKSVFWVSSNDIEKVFKCITWKKIYFSEKDIIDMKGRFKNGVFLAWSTLSKNKPVIIDENTSKIEKVKNILKGLKK